jgi:hypothetical protein
MAVYVRNMPHRATYWSPGTVATFGQRTYGAPVNITCRWQDSTELARASDGQEFTTSAVVYPDRDVELGGLLAPGWAASQDSAKEIRARSAHSNLGGTLTHYKAMI